MKIFCNGCSKVVEARLTDGSERYPHRVDLHHIPYYTCDACHGWVGTHYKSDDPLRPLGTIATKDMIKARRELHKIIDPIWKSGKLSRKHLYARISKEIGHTYHTGEIKSIEEARDIYRIVAKIHNSLV